MGKSTISIAIFNSYFDITRGYHPSSSFTSTVDRHRHQISHQGHGAASADWQSGQRSQPLNELPERARQVVFVTFVPPYGGHVDKKNEDKLNWIWGNTPM